MDDDPSDPRPPAVGDRVRVWIGTCFLLDSDTYRRHPLHLRGEDGAVGTVVRQHRPGDAAPGHLYGVQLHLPVDAGGDNVLLETAYRADELERLDEPGRARRLLHAAEVVFLLVAIATTATLFVLVMVPHVLRLAR